MYTFGAGVQFFLQRRIRRGAAAIAMVLMGAVLLSMGHAELPPKSILLIASFAIAIVLLALPMAFLRKVRGLEAKRELPRYATAGEQVRCTIELRNRGGKTARSVWLSETPPDPRPSLNLFLHSREPGEDERNAFDRKFAYYRWRWLMDRLRLYEGGTSLHPVQLAPGASTEVIVEFRPGRRGVIRMDDLRMLLPDPFGLFQRCVKLPAPPATLTILPQRFRIPPVELPGSGRFQIGGEAATNAVGNAGEFVGLRDYRAGDPLRQIHWKSWARTGRPIVKELEDTFYPRYGLVLDTFPESGKEMLFEDAVSIAASFASTIDTKESLLDLMFIKDRAHTVTVGRGLARSELLLDVLATVEPETTPQFDVLSRLVLKHREDLTSCLVVLSGWSESRADFVRDLTKRGIPCVVLVAGHGPAPEDFRGYWIESGHLARDLGSLPIRLQPSHGKAW
jgi:uncharacterized protein (DUF58 family)